MAARPDSAINRKHDRASRYSLFPDAVGKRVTGSPQGNPEDAGVTTNVPPLTARRAPRESAEMQVKIREVQLFIEDDYLWIYHDYGPFVGEPLDQALPKLRALLRYAESARPRRLRG